MKQTIISKCFDKMKRVALTLFAALCVGSVWAEEESPSVDESVQNVVDLNSSVFAISDKVYTGSALVSGLIETDAYTVEDVGGDRINVGEQKVRVTLKEGYTWSDDDVNTAKEFSWNITQSPNDWLVAPVLSPNSWPQALAKAGRVKFIAPQPSFGELVAEIASNGGNYESFNGTLPTAPGDYAIRYSVEGSLNWAAKEWSVEFTIYPSEDFDYGYRVFGLGANKDEVAVVFTKSGTWKVPINIENAQFLVVGGGGGGGADSSADDEKIAGAGGGGGGIVAGYVNLIQNQTVSVTVGSGGKGGIPGKQGLLAKFGAAQSKATDSKISFDNDHYVLAYKGGGDQGAAYKNGTSAMAGEGGGSSAGSRPTIQNQGSSSQGKVTSNTVVSSTKYGKKGGKGASQYQSGGGGGATDLGDNGTENGGGAGGEGLSSDITGALLVYGSGGGGGGLTAPGANGGTSAGNGGYYNEATSATPNQGGGGGGAGRIGNGGDGASGIVVFRYASKTVDNFIYSCQAESELKKEIKNLNYYYNGQEQSVSPELFFNSEDWEITGAITGKAVGEYRFFVVPKNGLCWSDGTEGAKEFIWTIQIIHPSYGYSKQVEEDVVVIFTNHLEKSSKWIPERNIKDVEFLVVGGGGGGGGAVRYNHTNNSKDYVSPGGGGGGGGVVAGYITELRADEAVNVSVGRGGKGGDASTASGAGKGAAGSAENSSFGVGDFTYVIANKGGSDSGYDSPLEPGASLAGRRYGVSTNSDRLQGGEIKDGAPIYGDFVVNGCIGGMGMSANESKTINGSGGGGGAMGDGGDATNTNGGNGGEGYKSSITGTELDYGSGGGGGGGGGIAGGDVAGDGAGVGGESEVEGGNAMANRGGGGGGGGASTAGVSNKHKKGGAGGSGIVVFRYNKYPVGVVTADGVVYYETLDAAISATQEGETIKLFADVTVDSYVVIPTGATLDLNGKSIQALAVVGKLAMNGGALKTYDTNTQTYFFMAAPAQTAGALYWTSNAVMTIGADYTLSLDGGSVTLPNSWRSLLKQSLTIKSGATFVIPQGVELNLRGNAVVESGATLTCEGTIALGNTYDAIDTSATLTSVQLAEGKVTSAVEGYKAIYENGAYKLVEATVTVVPGGAAVVVATEADADAVEIAVEVPAGVNISLDAYKAYFTKSVTQNSEGKYEVTAVLDDTKVKPVIAETTADDTTKEAFVIDADGNVTLNINNKKPGLYYGVQVLKELGADPVAVVPETEAGALVVTADNIPDGNAAFFKVIVDFAPIVVPEAE